MLLIFKPEIARGRISLSSRSLLPVPLITRQRANDGER